MYLHKLQNVKEQIYLVLEMFDYLFFSFLYDRTRFELGVSFRGMLYKFLSFPFSSFNTNKKQTM